MPVSPTLERLRSIRSRRRTRRAPPSLEDLRTQVAELEAEAGALGARGIEQDRPGVFATLIDLLSRPNYAVVSLASELLGEQPSVTRGVKGALTEIFSGVGGLRGEKRAFGELLEDLGVPTKTLADAFPALEGTWVGNFGSRGAAGIALDIAFDPLTYMTFGASGGLRVATSKGIRHLNKAGKDLYGRLWRKNLDQLKPTMKGADPVAQTRLMDQVVDATEKEFERLYTVGDDISKEFLEPGGAKIFGKQIPGTDKLGPALGKTINMLPESISRPAVEGATKMAEGMRRMVSGIFSPEGALANLPQPLRERATRLTNSFFRASTAHRAHLMSQVDPLERVYRKLEKADPGIGERWYDVREGIRPKSDITNAEELAAYEQTMALYESMGETLVQHGVLGDERILPNYIFHQYKNVEALQTYHPRPGVKLEPGSKATFEKERRFADYRLAQEESKRMHDLALSMMSRGEAEKWYPILEPEFDVFKNMKTYVGQHADVLARKAWREEMVQRFGKKLDEFDFDALYEDLPDAAKAKPGVKGAPEGFNPENVPLRRVVEEGDIEPVLAEIFGPDGAQYVANKSKLTNNELVYLPKEIVRQLENVNASVFNTKDHKAFGKLLNGFDWLNNNFKWGVYTVWPASATRDAYSNIALSMLRIGLAALDPKKHIDTIRMMAGRDLAREFAGSGFTIGQLRDLSKTLGVWVPGQVFVEQTGRFKLGRFRRALTEKRAAIENEARVQLWLEEIRRGADPRSAADTVGRFLFNYGEVSRVERDLFRRMIPFYTFTRKNVERQWKTLKSKPGLQVNQLKPFRGRQDENEEMVKWEGEALKIRMDRDGKTVHMLTGIDLPLRNVDVLWRGTLGSTLRSQAGMITPVIKSVIELTAGKDFFTNRDLDRATSGTLGRFIEKAGTPTAVKNWLGYKKEVDAAGRPRYTFDGERFHLLFRSWMFSRAISTSDRVFREYTADGNTAAAMLDLLTGIRAKTLDMDEQARKKLNRRIRELEESLIQRGARGRFSRAFAPRERGELQ